MRVRWIFAALTLVSAASIFLTGCVPSTNKGTVNGTLSLVMPVTNQIRLLPGTVIFTSSSGSATTLRVPKSGRFEAHLSPNRYVAVGFSPQYDNGSKKCFGNRTMKVVAGTSQSIAVICRTL
jgi:hypothetical protein